MTQRAHKIRPLKSNDVDVRLAITRKLLAEGITRRDIRHEITLDTSSSGGRADVVVLHDNAILGIEIKSGKDCLDRADAQLGAYDLAFDTSMLIVDTVHLDVLDKGTFPNSYRHLLYCHEAKQIVQRYWDLKQPKFLPTTIIARRIGFNSNQTCVARMGSLLWAEEVSAVTGRMRGIKSNTRCAGLEWIRENAALKQLRPLVVGALRQRVLNSWEKAFWLRFDADADLAA